MRAIYLVRHGETDWNRERRLQGITDVPLNGAGLAQAHRLAKHFRYVRISVVFTSPLSRARQTARIVSQPGNWPVVAEDDLREIDHGMWTGMTTRVLARRFPEKFAIWRSRPDRLRLSTGEELQQVYRRATRFLSGIMGMKLTGNVLIVSHGVINALLMCAALQVPVARVWDFPQPNGCVNILRFRERRLTAHEGPTDVSD